MIDLTGLLTPILLGISLLTMTAVTDLQSTYIADVAVPDSVSKLGYSEDVVQRVLGDRIIAIEGQAKTRAELRKLMIESERSLLGTVIDYVNLTPVVRAFQKSSRLLSFYVTAEIVEIGDKNRMRLRFVRHDRNWRTVDVEKPKDDLEGLMQESAEAILKVTDPQILCTARLRAAIAQPASGVKAAQDCIDETLPYAEREDRPWLINLNGVLAFLRADRPTAAAWFRTALREEQDFSPALVNLAILDFLEERYDRSLVRSQEVFRKRLPSDSPQTYAAAYLYWGLSLVKLNRYEEAVPIFEKSIAADPQFGNVYVRWAEVERARGNTAKAESLDAQAKKFTAGEQLYTENLLGAIQELGTRAASGR